MIIHLKPYAKIIIALIKFFREKAFYFLQIMRKVI